MRIFLDFYSKLMAVDEYLLRKLNSIEIERGINRIKDCNHFITFLVMEFCIGFQSGSTHSTSLDCSSSHCIALNSIWLSCDAIHKIEVHSRTVNQVKFLYVLTWYILFLHTLFTILWNFSALDVTIWPKITLTHFRLNFPRITKVTEMRMRSDMDMEKQRFQMVILMKDNIRMESVMDMGHIDLKT